MPKKERSKHHLYEGERIPRDGPPDIVSIHFAAKVIGVHSHTVRRWIKCRFLPGYRINWRLGVRRDHVMQVTRALKVAMDDPGWGDHYACYPGLIVRDIRFIP